MVPVLPPCLSTLLASGRLLHCFFDCRFVRNLSTMDLRIYLFNSHADTCFNDQTVIPPNSTINALDFSSVKELSYEEGCHNSIINEDFKWQINIVEMDTVTCVEDVNDAGTTK